MFKIGEFSKLVKVSARMLRYYDQCGLFRPAEIDRYTGYRLYSAVQIPILSRIIGLRDMGFRVEEIEDLLPRYDDAEYMRCALVQKQAEIDAAIAQEQSKLDNIAALCSKLGQALAGAISRVELKALPSVQVLALREIIPSYEAEYELWKKMDAFVKKSGIVCDLNGYSIYYDDEYKEEALDVEIAVPVETMGESRDGFVYRTLEAVPQAATIRFANSYENYDPAIEKLALWIEEQGFEVADNVRGLTLTGPQSGAEPRDWLTELQIPVRKKR